MTFFGVSSGSISSVASVLYPAASSFSSRRASVAAEQGIDTFDGFVELARIVSEELEYSEQNTDDIKFTYES